MIRQSTPRRGRLGDLTTQYVGQGASIAGAALTTVGALATPAVGLLSLSATAAAALPIAGAVIGVGVLIFSMLHNSRGLQQDAETTAEVNSAEAYMRQNLAAWNASSKNLATQKQALLNFDNAWQSVVNFCGQASEGSPGARCIAERTRGSKYDYPALYRDPIANDPQAGAVDRAAQQQSQSFIDPATGQPSTNTLEWLIPAALVLAAVVL